MELIGVKNAHAFIFSENNIPKWKLELMSSFWGQKIALVDLERKKITAFISKKLRLIFNGRTTINFTEKSNNKLIIPFKYFSSQIDFKYEKDYYEFIEHSGLVYSIFKNNKQIGFYKKQQIQYLNKEGIKLEVNNDSDILLILSVLSITDINFYNSESMITTNVGNLIVSKRKFDKTWRSV